MEGENIFKMIAGFVREHRRTKIGRAVTDALACVVVFATVYALILPAITETADTVCGKEEHTHTEECYASAYDLDKIELSCMEGLHQHTDECYDKDGDLICGYADYYIHTHDESCYDEDGVLICPLKEHTGKTHIHDKDCYDEDGNLTCGKFQVEAHQHTSDCYDEDNLADAVSGTTLICDKEEHTHGDACYADSSDDADAQGSTAVADAEDGIEEEVTEEDSSLNVSSGSARSSIKTNAGNTVHDSNTFRNHSTITYTNATYDGTEFTAQLTVTFTDLETDYIKRQNYTINYYLPDGVSPPADYDGSELSGYDSAGNLGFTYYYKQDSNGNWYVEINFVQSYIDSAGSTVSGNFSFTATIDSTSWDDNKGLVIKYKDQTVLTIPASEITWEQGTSVYHDLSVTKSASSYDAATNSITYTVTVTSDKGTEGNVSLSDVLTLPSGLTVESVTLDSITYKTGVDQYGNYTSSTDETSTYSSSFNYNSSDYTTSLTLGTMAAGSSYVIKYTVTFDEISAGNYSEKVGNKVTASSDDSVTGTIEDTAEKSVTVTYKILEKSATRNETTGDITWKIVVNESGADISGTTLTDVMMTGLTDNDVTVTTSGTYGTDYVFTYDQEGKITGIKFLPEDGSSANTYTYTITYTTTNPLTWGEGQTNITNTAHLKGDDIDTSAEKTAYEGVSGSLTKTESADATYTDTDKDGVNDQATLTWSASAIIPAGGISAGTELTDYLSGASNYTTVNDQWYTYSQIISDFSSIAYNLAITDMDGVNTLVSLSGGADSTADYTLSFYDQTANGTWVTYYDLVANKSTYESHVFTAWKITFNKDVSLTAAGKFSLTYTSTADVSGVTNKKEYTNAINVANITATAKHVEAVDVLKMDAKENAEDSTTTSTDGTVAWKVRISADSIAGESSITVTDTLPAGVTLSAIYLSENISTNYLMTYDESAGTLSKTYWTGSDNLYVTGTVTTDQTTGQQVITLTIPSSVYSYMADSSGFIWIYYQCKLSDDLIASGTVSGTTVTISGLTNSVTVKGESGTEIGTDTQTQTVEYTQQVEEVDVLSKSSSWDNTNHYMDYSIVINPEAKDLLTGGDELSLEDVLTVQYNLSQNWGLTASLIQSSVKFYEAVYNDAKKEYEKGNEISIAWTYDYESTDSYGTVTYKHTISATIPDETAIIMEYTYYLTNMKDGDNSFNSGDIQNTVTLTGDSEQKDTENGSGTYSDTGYSASITGGDNYYRVYKVDSGNYATTLDGAVFTLYRYDSSATEWVSTGLTYTTSNGVLIVTKDSVESASQYYANTAYKLVETTAPDGYVADSSLKLWFYWSDSTVSTTSYPDDFTSSAMDLSLSAESVYAPNEPTPTTEVSVEKKWLDTDGTTEKTTELPSSIIVDLYRYGVVSTNTGAGTTDTYDVYVGNGTYTLVESVPVGEEVTIEVSGSSVTWYSAGCGGAYQDVLGYDWSLSAKSFTVTVPSTNTSDIYIAYGTISSDDIITISYASKNTGGGTGNTGNTTYTESDLSSLGGTLYQSGIEITDADSWTKTITDLPAQGDDGNGNTIYYYYYFVERSVAGYTTAYSSGEGVTDGTITITNTSTGESYELPAAGGPGTIWYMMSGLLLMLVAAVALYINHRRERTSIRK